MGCTNCKNKESLKREIYESTKIVDRGVVIFAIVWSALAIYGLISLIGKFL
jgi:hypothetical protein